MFESFITQYYRLIFGVLVMGIAGLSFYVGILEGKQSAADSVTLSCSPEVLSSLSIPVQTLATGNTIPSQTPTASTGMFAGSKNGTKYYTPGCAGLQRIKPENIIWFKDAEDATLQGYTPARC